jgi:hypothetical protein
MNENNFDADPEVAHICDSGREESRTEAGSVSSMLVNRLKISGVSPHNFTTQNDCQGA